MSENTDITDKPKSGVTHITVSDDDDGQRLDRWLKRYVPDIPYGLAQKLIRKGQFRVDGKRARGETKLVAGQSVRIPPIKPDKPAEHRFKPEKQILSNADIGFIKSLVIYDDGDIIALNKPHGLAVQGGTNTTRHVDGMLDGLINKDGVRPRLVHRLDKDTSGVLLLARSSHVARKLGQMFKGRDIKKLYWAIVTPRPELFRGAVNAALIKAGGANKERMVVDTKNGKRALTEYIILEHMGDQAAFVAFWPRTGRTHQIRVHAEVMGSPILGDVKYRGALAPEERQHGSGSDVVTGLAGLDHVDYARRLHLHAQRLMFNHPTQKGMVDIAAPLSPELAKSWKAFGFSTSYKDDPFDDVDA